MIRMFSSRFFAARIANFVFLLPNFGTCTKEAFDWTVFFLTSFDVVTDGGDGFGEVTDGGDGFGEVTDGVLVVM